MKKTKFVNVMFEIEIDEEAQEMIEYFVSEFARIMSMTEEQSRIFVDLIIETGFRRNRDPDITELLLSVSAFLSLLKSRLSSSASQVSTYSLFEP